MNTHRGSPSFVPETGRETLLLGVKLILQVCVLKGSKIALIGEVERTTPQASLAVALDTKRCREERAMQQAGRHSQPGLIVQPDP